MVHIRQYRHIQRGRRTLTTKERRITHTEDTHEREKYLLGAYTPSSSVLAFFFGSAIVSSVVCIPFFVSLAKLSGGGEASLLPLPLSEQVPKSLLRLLGYDGSAETPTTSELVPSFPREEWFLWCSLYKEEEKKSG